MPNFKTNKLTVELVNLREGESVTFLPVPTNKDTMQILVRSKGKSETRSFTKLGVNRLGSEHGNVIGEAVQQILAKFRTKEKNQT